MSIPRHLGAALIAGALLGPLDLAGQVHAPYPVAHLFNSPAIWAAAAFGFGWWASGRSSGGAAATSPWRTAAVDAMAAVVMLVVAVEAYYLADVVARGAEPTNLWSSTAAFWVAAAGVAGVVFGGAGSIGRAETSAVSMSARACLPAVFGAEAVHHALRIATEPAAGRPDDLPSLVGILAGLAVVTTAWLARGVTRSDRRRLVLTVAGVTAAGAGAFLFL